jgi:hypothetical protein
MRSLLGKWCILPEHHARLSWNIALSSKLLFIAKCVNKGLTTAVNDTGFRTSACVGCSWCCHIEELGSGCAEKIVSYGITVVLEILTKLVASCDTLTSYVIDKIAVKVTAVPVISHVISRLAEAYKLVSLNGCWNKIVYLKRIHPIIKVNIII